MSRNLSAKANAVPLAVNAHKELRALLGFDIERVTWKPNPSPDDRNIHNEPRRRGLMLTLPGDCAIHLESSDDARDPRLLNVWRRVACRYLGSPENVHLEPLTKAQCARVLILLHTINEESS